MYILHCLLNFSSEVTSENNLKLPYKNKQLIEINKKNLFLPEHLQQILLVSWIPGASTSKCFEFQKKAQIVPDKFKSYQESWPLFHVHWSVKFLIDTILHRLTSADVS